MKKMIFVILTVLLLCIPPLTVYAYETTLRIGLEGKSCSILNYELEIGYEENGQFVKSAVVQPTGAFSAIPANSYFISTGEFFSDYTSALSQSNVYKSMGHPACVAITDTYSFSVYLGGYSANDEAERANLIIGGTVLPPNNRRTALIDSSETLLFDNPYKHGQIRGINPEPVSIGGSSYRGVIELYRENSAHILPVNIINSDEYLYSVLPAEMPSSWHTEALKAQAVTCRSYAATKIGSHSGYDLCNKVHCQLYNGYTAETPETNDAVNSTRGLMAYHNGSVINAVYFSSSGGVTADSETVWSETVPYLRSVREINETTSKNWTRAFTLNEITDLLIKNNKNIGNALSVSISAGANGRVNILTINGSNGQVNLEKESIRSFFSSAQGGALESRLFSLNGQINSSAATSSAYPNTAYVTGATDSGSFYLADLTATYPNGLASAELGEQIHVLGAYENTVIQKNKTENNSLASQAGTSSSSGNTVVFTGMGYGHGVGLSQHGANGMAQAGYSFTDILKHYYIGIEIW